VSRAREIEESVRKLIDPIVEREAYELIDVELVPERGRTVLRVTIDSTIGGSIGVDDCSHVSRVVGDALDVEDLISGSYALEVSSPGIFRPLTKPAHFDRAIGQRVKVKTFEKHDNRRVFTGVLEGHSNGILTVDVDGQKFALSLDAVAKANLEPLEL
jgi:ribosome maturation factor RimP